MIHNAYEDILEDASGNPDFVPTGKQLNKLHKANELLLKEVYHFNSIRKKV